MIFNCALRCVARASSFSGAALVRRQDWQSAASLRCNLQGPRRLLSSLHASSSNPFIGRSAWLPPSFTQHSITASLLRRVVPRALAEGTGNTPGHVHTLWTAGVLTPAAALATFKAMGIGGWFLVDLGIQVGGWAISSILKTEKLYDLLGTGSFAVLAAGSLALGGPITPRKVMVSAMVGVWAARLGSYLVARVHKVGKDSRFDEVKHKPAVFLFYWTMQALWVWVTVSPVLIVNTVAATTPLGWLDFIGLGIWVAGMAFEGVADAQKDAFRSRPENKGRFITEGLWATSRHPNYFGEIVLWWGMLVACASGFTKPVHYASVASPLVVMLLLRYMSGVPILERQADARWGGQPDYEAYKAATPVLVPDLGKLIGARPAA